MDILGKARKLESTLARHFDRAAQQWSKTGPRGPLEVLHGILHAVDERVEPAGRGTHVFPFNRIKVSIVAATRDTRARFASVIDDPNPIVHCGSGVTACHNALAMEAAGLPLPRVYVGSWSGWISDPDRPIATGPQR